MRITLSMLALLLLQFSVVCQEPEEEPPTPDTKEDSPTPEAEAGQEPSEFAVRALKMTTFVDADSKDGIAFEKLKAKQLEYYLAAKKLKNKKDELAALKEQYKDLLTTQQFLAADKNGDSKLTSAELTMLFETSRLQYDLTESDVELMVEDWMLRYKTKCPVLYSVDEWHESKIQKRYKHLKRKLSKDDLRARPYREAIIRSVLSARRHDAFAREFTWEQWSSVFRKIGLRFKFAREYYVSENENQLPQELKDSKIKSIWAPSEEAEGRKYLKFKNAGLTFEYTATDERGYSDAGKIACRMIEVKFGEHVLKSYRHKKYPFIPVVIDETIFDEKDMRTLKNIIEPE